MLNGISFSIIAKKWAVDGIRNILKRIPVIQETIAFYLPDIDISKNFC